MMGMCFWDSAFWAWSCCTLRRVLACLNTQENQTTHKQRAYGDCPSSRCFSTCQALIFLNALKDSWALTAERGLDFWLYASHRCRFISATMRWVRIFRRHRPLEWMLKDVSVLRSWRSTRQRFVKRWLKASQILSLRFQRRTSILCPQTSNNVVCASIVPTWVRQLGLIVWQKGSEEHGMRPEFNLRAAAAVTASVCSMSKKYI